MNSPKLNDKISRNSDKRKPSTSFAPLNDSEGDIELSQNQILERVKSDRVTVTKPEEDRRRRTIIVEKKNGYYGFSLQSYGIHYKKEQEIEMITYVDHVDYDGPAYRAGMRQGDVILSINGHDMEKTDHKTLVNFIKNCDSRMRMVVLFEDCVRKVELHMRYIHLQRILQSKTLELEKLCLKEKELLQGKWKTRSLPARKKASSKTDGSSNVPTENGDIDYVRPTVSTEDVALAQPASHNPVQQLLMFRPYQYTDAQGYTIYIHPTTTPSSSSEYLLASWQGSNSESVSMMKQPRVNQHCQRQNSYQHYSRENVNRRRSVLEDPSHYYQQINGFSANNSKSSKSKSSQHESKSDSRSSRLGLHHSCNPCKKPNPVDNTSLEAYDLASPCCSAHCIPRRRSRHKSKSSRKSSHSHDSNSESVEKGNSRSVQVSIVHTAPSRNHSKTIIAGGAGPHRYVNLVSQYSLQSCPSSEFSRRAEGESNKGLECESSAASCTTLLSTDTLYWDPPSDTHILQRHSVKSSSSRKNEEAVKPVKSWDNLTTKAFGGYGFGYDYLDRDFKNQAGASIRNSHSHMRKTRYVQPTKSSESLLLISNPNYPNLSDSSLSCDFLDSASPKTVVDQDGRHFTLVNSDKLYHRFKGGQTSKQHIVNIHQAPEITRL